MKIRNPKEKPDNVSIQLSLKTIPKTLIPFCLSTNFIDKFGKNPPQNTSIYINDIVFTPSEITDNNWMFTINDQANTVKNIFKNNPKWKCICIKDINKLKMQNKSNEKGNIQTITILKIDPFYIVNKYNSPEKIREFKHNKINNYIEKINQVFKIGDEILYYNERLSETLYGFFVECFIIMRNNKIVTSFIINVECRDGAKSQN